MIPAIIHYIWLGKSEIPKIYLDCMESWKEHAVNYDCYLWNEDSYRKEFGQNDFVEEMIQRKKFAFAADLIRCDVLYRFGGIYLDTDMELVRDISALRKILHLSAKKILIRLVVVFWVVNPNFGFSKS